MSDPTNTTPPDPTPDPKPASKARPRLSLTTEEAMLLLDVNNSDDFVALAKEEKFTVLSQSGDNTEYLRSDLMAYKARVEEAAKKAAEAKAKEAEKKAPDVSPTGSKKVEDSETHTAKCPCGCRARARATAKVGDIHVHLPPTPAPAEEKHTARMPWWLIPVVILGTLLALWLCKSLVTGGGKDTAAVPAAAAKGEVDTAKAVNTDPDATQAPPAAKAVDEEARAAAKAAQETAKNAALVAGQAAADLKVHHADAESRWTAQAEKNSELDAADDIAIALATAKSSVVNPPEPPTLSVSAPLTSEESAALVEFTRVAKFAIGWAKQGRTPLVVGAEQKIAGSPSYQVLKGIGAARIRAQVPTALVPREFLDTMLVSLQIQ
jgi:hypothetical protein